MYDFENDSNYIYCNKIDLMGLDKYAVMIGEKIKTDWKKLIFEFQLDEGYEYTDYLANVYGWFVVSEEFIELTNNIMMDSIQYLDIEIKDVLSDETIQGYKVGNIIDVVDALDLSHSLYDELEIDNKKIILVKKYALMNSVKEHHIFKLKGYEIPIFVSELVKKLIEKNKLKGFDFLEVDIY